MAFGPAPQRSTMSNRKPSKGLSVSSTRQRSPAVKAVTGSVPVDESVLGLSIEDLQAQIEAEQEKADKCRARCQYLQKVIADAEAEAAQYRSAIAKAEAPTAGEASSQNIQQILCCVLEVMQPVRQKLMAKAAAGTLTNQESIAYVALTGWWFQKHDGNPQEETSEQKQISVTPAHRRQVRSLSPPTLASLPTSQCPTPQTHTKPNLSGSQSPRAMLDKVSENMAGVSNLQMVCMPMKHTDLEVETPSENAHVEVSQGAVPLPHVTFDPQAYAKMYPSETAPVGISQGAVPTPHVSADAKGLTKTVPPAPAAPNKHGQGAVPPPHVSADPQGYAKPVPAAPSASTQHGQGAVPSPHVLADPHGHAKAAAPAPHAFTQHLASAPTPLSQLNDNKVGRNLEVHAASSQASSQPTQADKAQQKQTRQSVDDLPPMSQLKKKLDQDLEMHAAAKQPNQGQQKELQLSAEEQPEASKSSEEKRTSIKEKAQLMRQKLLERKRRMSEELKEPPQKEMATTQAEATFQTEVVAEDQPAANEAKEEKAADIKQQRRESLKAVRQHWQEKKKKKKKQNEKELAQQSAEQQQIALDAITVQVSEPQEPQSYMAQIMKEYKDSKDSEERPVDAPSGSNHTLLSNEQGLLGHHVEHWAEQKQKLLQREDEVRKRWGGIEGLLPAELQQKPATKGSVSVSSLSTSASATSTEKLNPQAVPLRSMVGKYASEDCGLITVQASGAVFFDAEDMGVVIAQAPDGTPLLRPRGIESSHAGESGYAFRLIAHSDTEFVWQDEVDPSAPYVRWKRAFTSNSCNMEG